MLHISLAAFAGLFGTPEGGRDDLIRFASVLQIILGKTLEEQLAVVDVGANPRDSSP